MQAISSNALSHDQQVMDALDWLKVHRPKDYGKVSEQFPEIKDIIFDGAWVDTDAMDVEIEFMSWLTEGIIQTGHIMWENGEPWETVADVIVTLKVQGHV